MGSLGDIMMNNMRRGFLKNLGFISAFASGAVAAKIVVEEKAPDPVEPKEDTTHLAPDSISMFTLQGNPKPVVDSNGFSIGVMNPEYQNKVNMAVGKDNRLWIQVDNKWQRVALET